MIGKSAVEYVGGPRDGLVIVAGDNLLGAYYPVRRIRPEHAQDQVFPAHCYDRDGGRMVYRGVVRREDVTDLAIESRETQDREDDDGA